MTLERTKDLRKLQFKRDLYTWKETHKHTKKKNHMRQPNEWDHSFVGTIHLSTDFGGLWRDTTMRWLQLVGSFKLQVSFAEYDLFYRALLQKRPIILRSLLIEATPYGIRLWREGLLFHIHETQPTKAMNTYGKRTCVLRFGRCCKLARIWSAEVCGGVSKYGSPFTYISLVWPAICAQIWCAEVRGGVSGSLS